MTWLGLDIGGANLKVADGGGWARRLPFALWREPAQLGKALSASLHGAPDANRLAVTMTGELCDCFRTKADGVAHILAAVRSVADGRETAVYLTNGRFAATDIASDQPQLAAASNWRALATFACRYTNDRPGILIDIGSTTTDIVPLIDGQPCHCGLNDTERLVAGELVYTGVGRTPICAVTTSLPWRGSACPVAAELFATTADAYVLFGDLAEDPEATWTADGRPLTAEFARERLARMVCADATSFSAEDARQAAEIIRNAQIAQLQAALSRAASGLAEPCEFVVMSGAGEFLARSVARGAIVNGNLVSLSERLGPDVSSCAPAHAVAALAAEEFGP
jgi:(4-(4-[2-(gamma-L-glutamylamino)ethyl]phenoxymethyl)furan-2-yl)methanamine synthase